MNPKMQPTMMQPMNGLATTNTACHHGLLVANQFTIPGVKIWDAVPKCTRYTTNTAVANPPKAPAMVPMVKTKLIKRLSASIMA